MSTNNFVKNWRKLKDQVEDQKIRINDIQDRIYDQQVRINDIQDRVYDLIFKIDELTRLFKEKEDKLNDTNIRVRDIQDLTNDFNNSGLRLIPEKINDIKVRTKDAQDRAYDILWKIKTSNYQRSILFWETYKKEDESVEDAKKRFFLDMPKADGNKRLIQELMITLIKKVDDVCRKNDLHYWMDFGTLLGAARHKGFIPWDDDVDLAMMRDEADKLEEILANDNSVKVRHVWGNSHNGNGVHRVMQIRWNDFDQYGLLNNLDIFTYDYCENKEGLWDKYNKVKDKLVEISYTVPKSIPRNEDESLYPEIYDEIKRVMIPEMENAKEVLGVTKEKNDYIMFAIDNLRILKERIYKYDDIFPLIELDYEGNKFYAPNNYLDILNAYYGDIYELPEDMLSHTHFRPNEKALKMLNEVLSIHKEKNNK